MKCQNINVYYAFQELFLSIISDIWMNKHQKDLVSKFDWQEEQEKQILQNWMSTIETNKIMKNWSIFLWVKTILEQHKRMILKADLFLDMWKRERKEILEE